MIVAQRKITTQFSEGYSSQKLVGSVLWMTSAYLQPQNITSFSDCAGVILVHSSSTLFHG